MIRFGPRSIPPGPERDAQIYGRGLAAKLSGIDRWYCVSQTLDGFFLRRR